MNHIKSFFAFWATLAALLVSSEAAAVNCTLNGSVTLQPQDSYYCDTTVLGASACAGWKEVDLDTKTMPLQYMFITIQAPSGAWTAVTDANGNWGKVITLPGTSCTGQVVTVFYHYARVHEADVNVFPAPRIRFDIVDVDESGSVPVPGTNQWARDVSVTLTGSTTNVTQNWSRSSTANSTRLANVYFTMNSMMKEIVTWSSNIDASYQSNSNNHLRIGFEATFPLGGANYGPYSILIGYDAYGYGGIIRHELGHSLHGILHNNQRDGSCHSYKFNNVDGGPAPRRACDWGATATSEAITTFLGVRSIATGNTNDKVWACGCFEGGNQDVCSEHANRASDPDGDSDWFYDCQTGDGNMTFWYLGDFRSSSTANCLQLRPSSGCNCSGSPWCSSSFNSTNGWRNDAQITRFFWDLIDGNQESGDDDDYRIEDFVAALGGMACSGNLGGQDGSCEEQAPPPGGTCNPVSETATGPSGTGTRDSYNVFDIAEAFPGSQGSERTLNCVQGAID